MRLRHHRYVAEQWGRRWITIDTSRVALALARSRLMAAKYPYYLLADSEAGIAKEAEVSGNRSSLTIERPTNDVRRGFVYERVPHVTLKSIAQNPDIREGMTREEIDAAIARHADTETLFDRPYEDRKIIRVSGPFTFESLSPHRVNVDGPEDLPQAEAIPAALDAGRFIGSILDNLRRAGVQNTKRAERLEFLRLDPYPGVFVQGVGEYTEAGQARTVAIAIGPEFGTVGPELIRDAAKEAVHFADLLVVCGFAFDPLAGEEASTLGRLTILQARMNPDLAMGDELLKKTGTRQPVHGLRRARHRRPPGGGRPAPGGDPWPRRLRPHHRRAPLLLGRRHRRLVPGHQLRRRRLLRPPRLLHRRRRPLRQAPPSATRRHQRRGLGHDQLDRLAAVPAPHTAR